MTEVIKQSLLLIRKRPSPLVLGALVVTLWGFRKIRRKAKGEPYVVHLLATALILIEVDENSQVVAGGLIHDNHEDLRWSKCLLRRLFGWRIASWVIAVSHEDMSAPWEERTAKARSRLSEQNVPREALAISCAQHLANLRNINDLLEHEGIEPETYMTKDRHGNLAKYIDLLRVFEGRVSQRLWERYQREVCRLARLCGDAEETQCA